MKELVGFAVFGVLVHLILLLAVFKIYFKSPLEHGMDHHKSLAPPPAKRLVLFIADGLRAQSMYNHFQERAPFLDSVVKDKAAWGVAHTQVPTESRPGHVAILAGFNEDPSAITQGWQANPVPYDSVINQSSNAWCWGSPDIVKLFSHGHASHIHLSHYDPEFEDFSGKKSTTLLDTWVFSEVETFISKQDISTCTTVCEDGNIFFLHLLGLDTAGHSFKPLSPEYIKNIGVVDDGVKAITSLIDEFFNDSKTAYIFTSDHGMTNWGSHGDGSEHESSVPFIAWGAGIKHFRRRQDLELCNIAPLIASLLGTNIPVNSKGVVPLNYINATMQQKASMLHANAAQWLEQYTIKHNSMKKNSIPYLFKPFAYLTERKAFEMSITSSSLLRSAQYEESIKICYMLIDLCQNGLKYYHTYYQKLLLAVVGTGYVGWIVLLLISIGDLNTVPYLRVSLMYRRLHFPPIHQYGPLICGIICVLISNLIFVQRLDFEFYVYFLFPIITWYAVIHNYKKIVIMYKFLCTYNFTRLFLLTVLYLIGVELLVYTFYEPTTLFYLNVLVAFQTMWFRKSDLVDLVFVGRLIFFGLAPYIIHIQSDFNIVLQASATIGWMFYHQRHLQDDLRPSATALVLRYQVKMLVMAFINSICVELSISYGYGLWSINKYISWYIAVSSLIVPLFTDVRPGTRLVSATVAFITPYALMSSGCESLYMLFFLHLIQDWALVEQRVYTLSPTYDNTLLINDESNFTNEDTVHRCFYLLAFILNSFFGVGNMASLNSFNPTWVRCFVTVFSPFTMATLIIIKLILPFMVVLMAFRTIVKLTHLQVQNCFLIICLFCNLMVLQFFFLVKDEGSWLEIGLSLSRFIVAIVTTIALMLLYTIVGFYSNYVLFFVMPVNL